MRCLQTLFVSFLEIGLKKWILGLKMDFGLWLGFLGHILGSIKLLGSTHVTDHFGSDLISRHWAWRAWI